MREWMMSYGQYFCWMPTSTRTDFFFVLFSVVFYLFYSPFQSLSISLSLFIHYDRRFINRSNLPNMLTPDDLFFDLCVDFSVFPKKRIKNKFLKRQRTKSYLNLRFRPAEFFLKADTCMEKWKHVFCKIKSDFEWEKQKEKNV